LLSGAEQHPLSIINNLAGSEPILCTIRGRAPVSSTDLFTYDVAKDGTRFLVNRYIKPEHAPPLTILLNAAAN